MRVRDDQQCRDLLEHGVAGIHFYTFNRAVRRPHHRDPARRRAISQSRRSK